MKFGEYTDYVGTTMITEEPMLNIESLLLESVHLSNKEHRELKSFFERPRNGSLQLSSYDKTEYEDQTVSVAYKANKLIFEVPTDFYEVVGFIIDTCDDYGLNFKDANDRASNTTIITVSLNK